MSPHTGFTHESTYNESKEWYTPPSIFKALGLRFDLDPCAAPPPFKDFVPAVTRYTIKDDGLAKPWDGFVWMNPPYGQDTPRWVEKFVRHGCGLALVFARTDTRWFQQWAGRAALVCFVSGRIQFVTARLQRTLSPAGVPLRAPAGSLILAMGGLAERALCNSNLGTLWKIATR